MVRSDPVARVEAEPNNEIQVAAMVESVVGCKWSVRLLQLCAEDHRRPSAFLRACSGLSAKVMNERLHKLTRFGIVQRTVCGEKPPVEVEYRLTPFGYRFMTILEEIRRLQEAVDREAMSAPDAMQGESNRADNLTGRRR
ncbi:MAG: helix-turn-helix transcriptional regulator [Gemmatimonadetes bacterium]|nr:helix-turn-helix transcriptional regulator [Gemmatimonadota bacterium]